MLAFARSRKVYWRQNLLTSQSLTLILLIPTDQKDKGKRTGPKTMNLENFTIPHQKEAA